ncbi:hypothetical protein E2C01_079607 [Portunus trituberculatus]|uniref:Uncharacterized protein n=1 Tax=Portunus trituberculatus TaxID=210409 RepID=A0A5B7ITT6_PORTR|nr:hypothetical protein [Portunus trituberculatus]
MQPCGVFSVLSCHTLSFYYSLIMFLTKFLAMSTPTLIIPLYIFPLPFRDD